MANRKGDGKASKSAGSGKVSSRASESKIHDYRVWLECLNEGVWVIDRKGLVTYANPRMAEILGYPVEEITGKHIFAFMDEQGQKASLEYEQNSKKGVKERRPFEFIQKSGERIYTSIESAPLFDDSGKYQGIVAAVQDVTWQHEAEERLKQSDERYRTLFENSVEAIYIHDFEGNFIDANDTALALLGYGRDEIAGINFATILDPNGLNEALTYITDIMKTSKASRKVQHTLKRKGGGVIHVETSGSLLYRDGKPYAILGIASDITENIKTEEALRTSEERYRLLVENADQGILVVQDTLIKFLNTKLTEITEYPAGELLGRPFMDFVHPDDRTMVFDRHKRRLSGEEVPHKYAFRIVNKRGESRWLEISAVALQWEGRLATLNFLSDVTERVTAEQALSDSYQQYQNIIEFLPDATFVVDTRGTVIAWNLAVEEMTGVAKKDIIGKGDYAYSIPFYGERRKILIDYILENAPDIELKYVNIKKVGKILYGETFVPKLRGGKGAYCFAKASLLYNSKGELTGAIEGVRDTTEIKIAEQALQESEKKYRDIFDNSLDGIFQSSPEGRFFSVNRAMAKLYGVDTPEEMLSIITDVPSQLYADPARRKEMVRIMLRDGLVNNFEVEFLTRSGGKIWVSLNARVVKDEAGHVLRYEGTIKDISKHKHAEEELHKIQVMQKATLESTADGIIVTDLAGNILLTNKRFAEIWHYPQEIIHQGHARALLRYAWKDMEGPEDFLQRARKIRQSEELESSVTRFKDGRILERFSTPLIVNGEVAGRMASYRDVTDIHRMEEELYRTQKLDSLGILAGGIAHDFNNILTGILGNITLARMEAKASSSMFSILEEAEKAAIRAKDLTQQLLTFARGGAPIRKTASIPEILHDTVQFALRGSKSRCEFLIPDDLWYAEIDRGQISQVINNMVINSDEAMPQGGNITIKALNVVLKEDEVASLIPGRYIKIAISDTGLGMPEEHISRVFDPYFTTKQKGSGLGLATSYSIIKNHGGTITVNSRLGAGSTFNIFIPASEEQVEKQVTSQKAQLTRKGRILIMDDEAMVLEVATRMLRHIGFSDIQTAADGNEAVDAYHKAMQAGNPFTIVIMDLTVPGGMGGEEAVKSLLEIDPGVKVIVSSGYSSGPVLSNYKNYGFSAVVGKPYTVDELTHALDEALNT
jgi:PAS domain S-box-containing protein